MIDKNHRTHARVIHDPAITTAPGLAIAVLPNGVQALSSGLDFQLRLWDLEAGVAVKTWGAGGPLFSIKVISGGTIALLGAVQGIVRWDLESWDLYQPNTLWSYSAINTVAYAESTGEVLGGGEDTTIHRWNLRHKKKLVRLLGHQITVTAIDIDQAGGLAISGDLFGHLRLWDLKTGVCLRDWQGHDKPISSLDMTSDGRLALTASEDGVITLWDLQHGQALRTVLDSWVKDIALGSDYSWAFVAGEGGLTRWDLNRGEVLKKYEHRSITAISLSPDENVLVALLKNNRLLVY